MVAYLLFFTLLGMTLAVYILSKQDFLDPSFLWLTAFTVSSFNLLFNISRWNVELHLNTYCVIIGGSCCFIIGSLIYDLLNSTTIHNKKNESYVNNSITPICIDSTTMWLWTVLQTLSLIICLKAIMNVSSQYGYSGSISQLIAGYRKIGTFTTENISLGTIPNVLYLFCTNSAYIWVYLLARNYYSNTNVENGKLVKRSIRFYFINLIISLVLCLSKGGRQSAFQVLFAAIIMFLLFLRRKRGSKNIPLSSIFKFAIVIIIAIGSFQFLGNLLGRNSKVDFSYYLAIYLSAPIRNLDYYLNLSNHSSASIFGQMTFVRLINQIGSKIHNSSLIYPLDLPYLYANGYSCGNVYTTFYAFIYDFGYPGILFLPIIAGMFSKYLYRKIIVYRDKWIELPVVLYSFLAYQITFCFFSNKIYEAFITTTMIYRIIYWIVPIVFMKRIRFKPNRPYIQNHQKMKISK